MRAASPPRQMERENEMIVISHRLFDWEKRFRVSPGGVLPLDCLQKRGERVLQVQRAWREWYGAFRHPERRKTSCVKETLIQSQNQIMKLHK